MTWLLVGTGGAFGSIARHSVNVLIGQWAGRPVLLATAAVNIVGCALIGILAGLLSAGTIRMGTSSRVFVFVGILGGFTTFSSFGLDTLTLVREGSMGLAFGNVGAQVGLGLGGVFLGYWISK